jgi:hypothetical protein
MAVNIDYPALEHTFRVVKYTCKGTGLLKDGHPYESKLEIFLSPETIKAGFEPKERKAAAWWKAQCAFRGLSQGGSIAALQMRLRESKGKMVPELKDVEKDLNKQFKKGTAEPRGTKKEVKPALSSKSPRNKVIKVSSRQNVRGSVKRKSQPRSASPPTFNFSGYIGPNSGRVSSSSSKLRKKQTARQISSRGSLRRS